jgi:hypothetical protein
MTRAWFVLVLVFASCTKPNPDYCSDDGDCQNGTTCSTNLHACETEPDAALDGAVDAVVDGPFVARTVQEARATTTPIDTPVDLTNVVVVAVDSYGVRTGEFWVQQSGGGMGSGIHIYGGITSEVALLHPGDIIDVTGGRKVTFTPGGDTTGRKEIEITPMMGGNLTITKKGLVAVPLVATVDAAAIALLTPPAIDIEREKWAGMYIQVTLVEAATVPYVVGEPSFLEFPTAAFVVQSTQAEFPAGIAQNTCFSSIRGVVEYFQEYNLVPVRTSDVVIGTGCP